MIGGIKGIRNQGNEGWGEERMRDREIMGQWERRRVKVENHQCTSDGIYD